MSKVYVIGRGRYSDFHIEAVFSSEELANRFCEAYPGRVEEEYTDPVDIEFWKDWNSPFIMEYELDQVEFPPPGILMCYVSMELNGNSYSHIENCYRHSDIGLRLLERDTNWPSYKDGRFYLCGVVFAKDKEHAVKIANEMRVQLIASGEWK